MNEKVNCPFCKQWKHGHRVSEVKKHHLLDNINHDDWETVEVKIHKHHKGSSMCKGSDRILEFKLDSKGRLE